MFYWAFIFLIVSLVAGFLGFGGVAGTSAWIAQVIFIFGIIALLFALITGWARRGRV